jgi:spermidine synthase
MQGAALALFIVLLAVRRRVDRGRLLHRSPGDGALPDIVVRERHHARELWFEQGKRSMLQARVSMRDTLVSRLPYVDGLHLYMANSGSPRVLFIGCGAGIGPRQFAHLYPGATIDVVDVDARVFDVAAQFFCFAPTPTLRAHIGDGREFLERTDETFDRILVDVFGADDMPAALCTEEFFQLCRSKLTRGGMCVVNVASAVEGPLSALLRTMYASVAAAFGDQRVRVHAVPRGREQRLGARRRRNLLIFAFETTPPAEASSARIITVPSMVPALRTISAHRISLSPGSDPLRDRAVAGTRLTIR